MRCDGILEELRSIDVVLTLSDGKISYDAPAGTMTDDRLSRLRACRNELFFALRAVETEQAMMPEGIYCPFCRGRSLIAAPGGCECGDCHRLAWLVLPGGSIVRSDYAKVTL